jgi:hypothetical protein
MSFSLKKIITALTLTSFLMVVFFSLTFMMHGSDGRMTGTCPLSSPAEESICSQNTILSAIHHISAYQSLLNTQVGSSITLGLISLLLLALAFVISLKDFNLLNRLLYFNHLSNSPPPLSGTRKIIRWLSLFENSPSIA